MVILAGDTHPRLVGIRWAMDNFLNVPVLYVAGNHEFYGEKHPRLFEKMKALAAGSNVQVLEKEFVEIGSIRFFGATLWTDFALTEDAEAAFEASTRMTDFTRIRHWPTLRTFTPTHARLEHVRTLEALRACLASGTPQKTVVITHHAPSIQSVQTRKRQEHLSAAYASHLDSYIQKTQPALWIHGHIHRAQDYQIGRTRILANPRGYLGEDAVHSCFKPHLIVTL